MPTEMEAVAKSDKTIWKKIGEFFNSPRFFESTGAFGMMSAKYFLAIGSVWGWYLTIIGHALTGIFLYKLKFKIILAIIAEICLLSVYGLYKWTNHIVGFQPIDYWIMAICSVVAIVYIITESIAKRKFWINQTITTVAFSFATFALGFKLPIGWYLLLIGHSSNLVLFTQKKAWVFIAMQLISIGIVVMKLISIYQG